MNYNSLADASPEKHAEFVEWLTQNTVAALQLATGDEHKLRTAVQEYINTASAANITLKEMENMLGVNEPCIMDLASLSETDEEVLIDAFEALTNT